MPKKVVVPKKVPKKAKLKKKKPGVVDAAKKAFQSVLSKPAQPLVPPTGRAAPVRPGVAGPAMPAAPAAPGAPAQRQRPVMPKRALARGGGQRPVTRAKPKPAAGGPSNPTINFNFAGGPQQKQTGV